MLIHAGFFIFYESGEKLQKKKGGKRMSLIVLGAVAILALITVISIIDGTF